MSKGNKSAELLQRLVDARAVIDDCIAFLSTTPNSKTTRQSKVRVQKKSRPSLNFTLNERNFIRTYGRGLSGPKKFVLLLAFEVKGKVGTEVELDVLRTKWNKMTSKALMGYKFNLFYSNDAKTRGWVDSKKTGSYHLCKTWMEIFD